MELVTGPSIICLGEGMVEERVAADGSVVRHYGGDALNTAIHLARARCNVAFATALGVDRDSDALAAAWKGEGLDLSLVARHPSRTAGRYQIAVDRAGERSFSYDRSSSAAREMFALDRFANAILVAPPPTVFFFSLISLAILPEAGRDALIELARLMRSQGAAVAYDGNFRAALWESVSAAQRWHEAAVALTDFGFPTLEDEALMGSEADDPHAVAARWGRLGCGEVVVKAGAHGCLLPAGPMLPPLQILAPVDTSGAGDAFNAGYLSARLGGASALEAGEAGHRLAGWTIMRSGAIPPHDDCAAHRRQTNCPEG